MSLYIVPSGPMATTAVFASLATGTSIFTAVQAKPFNLARIVEYGCALDGNASATGTGRVELIETDVAATVTAAVDADIAKYGLVADVAAASVAGLTLGTTATGYNASGEGSITATRLLALPQFFDPTRPFSFVQQFPLGREPIISIAKFGRIRFKLAGAGVNATAYMILDI